MAAWDAALGFSGILLNENAPAVQGFLFFSENLAQHQAMLDEFEGEGYVRSPVEATLVETGELINSCVYSLKQITFDPKTDDESKLRFNS